MKKTKKLLACLIAAATMFTMGSTAFAAETEEKLPSDVGTVKITKQYKLENNGTESPAETFYLTQESKKVEDGEAAEAPDLEKLSGDESNYVAKVTFSKGGAGKSGEFVVTLPTYNNVGKYSYELKEVDGKTAGVINGCWIMSSIQAAEDQSGKWAIVNMPKLDGVDGATNYANCGGASWAVSSNCKNTELAFDFLKSTFGSSVELYDDLLPNAGAIASYIPAAQSDVYNQASDFYGGQAVYKDIVGYAGSVPAFDCGAYYSDIRSALTDAITNVVQNNADIDGEMNNAQETLEFNIEN